VRKAAAPKQASHKVAVRTVPAQPIQRQIAYDPGYASLGGPAPIIVQAKPSWARPGLVTAAAVLGFIAAGMCVIAAIFWFTTSEFAGDVNDVGISTGSYATKAMFHGIGNLLFAVGMVLGGIGAVSRQGWSRIALITAAGCEAAYSLYRIVDGTYGDLVNLFLDIIIIALVVSPQASRYFNTQSPVQQT
jgi:hypothetical protein